MKTEAFYKLIDTEIEDTIAEHLQSDPDFGKVKNEENRKSFAFLLWFLKHYHPEMSVSELKQYITEGNDDGSCDIIFSNKNRTDEPVYYVVQAKWFSQSNAAKTNKTGTLVKACMTDFSLIYNGKKPKSATNIKFNRLYDELTAHIRNNGKVKFIFLPLCKRTEETDSHIESFKSDLVAFEIYDINKLKADYIELRYKGAKTHNPLETPYEPIGDIKLPIKVEDKIEVKHPYRSYIFLVTPKMLYDLFNKYRFSLFYKNLRNPLLGSDFNKRIAETIVAEPDKFWYYNNGITAITQKIDPFNPKADYINVKGLQIINGAQTVYSIFSSYDAANGEDRRRMDGNAFITFRLITSVSKELDFKITRYTNSQNPISNRDFFANDLVQRRLQYESFMNANIWYETRRGEFNEKPPKGIRIVPNELLAQTYLSYFFKRAIDAKNKKRKIFQSKDENEEGLYEVVFNDTTRYDDILISYYLYKYVETRRVQYKKEIDRIDSKGTRPNQKEKLTLKYRFLQFSTFNILSAFKFVLEQVNTQNPKSINGKLLNELERTSEKIELYYDIITESMRELVEEKESSSLGFNYNHYFKSKEESISEVEAKLKRKLRAPLKKTLIL